MTSVTRGDDQYGMHCAHAAVEMDEPGRKHSRDDAGPIGQGHEDAHHSPRTPRGQNGIAPLLRRIFRQYYAPPPRAVRARFKRLLDVSQA